MHPAPAPTRTLLTVRNSKQKQDGGQNDATEQNPSDDFPQPSNVNKNNGGKFEPLNGEHNTVRYPTRSSRNKNPQYIDTFGFDVTPWSASVAEIKALNELISGA